MHGFISQFFVVWFYRTVWYFLI